MKILQLCKKVPYPLKDGESVAIYTISKGLAESGCEISLLSFNTSKHHVEWEKLPDELGHYKEIHKAYLDTSISYWSAFKNLWTNRSYNIDRFVDEGFSSKLQKLLANNDFDIIQLEGLYMASYISIVRKYSTAKIIMRSQNIESEIWQNLAHKTNSTVKAWYYDLCAKRLQNFESGIQDQYDLLLPITHIDSNEYKKRNYKGDKYVVPVGLDSSKYTLTKNEFSHPIRIGYIGSLDWKPNIEGINWLLNHWEEIIQQFPNLEFHLAGRNAGQKYNLNLPQFVMHGEVDDAIEFIKRLDILLVPLFSGSGMRVKILEGMILSKVVISTPKGFEGIEIEHDENALCYENLENLISCLHKCFDNPAFMEKMGNKARKFIIKEYENKEISTRLFNRYQSLIKK